MKPATFTFLLRSALLIGGVTLLVLALDYSGFYERFGAPSGIPAGTGAGPVTITSRGAPLAIERAEDGHFWVYAYVNDEPIRMMVDTGATIVILSESDAARLGYDFWEEEFTERAKTAGGAFRMAPVVLEKVEVGEGLVVRNVRAGVLMGSNDYSVLGLSFLNLLSGYEVEGDVLTLRP